MKLRIQNILLLTCLLLGLTACNDSVLTDEPNPGIDEPICALFQVRISLEGNLNKSRAGVNEPNQTEDSSTGHSIEQTVSTVHLFVVPMDAQGSTENWSRAVCGRTTINKVLNGTDCLVKIPVSLIQAGRMNLYVGANLNSTQEDAFMKNSTHVFRTDLPYYYQAINEFAPFGNQQDDFTRNPKSLAMFCREPLTINLTPDQLNSEKPTTIDIPGVSLLKRLVAKILLTCQTHEGTGSDQPILDSQNLNEVIAPGGLKGIQYVESLRDFQQIPKQTTYSGLKAMGWIRQSDVHYFVNSMPRLCLFLPKYKRNTDGTLTDQVEPNFNLKEVFNQLGSFSPLTFKEQMVKSVYIHYTMLEMHQFNQSFQQSSVWDPNAYDELIEGTENTPYNRYGVGMYTLENMFGVNQGDFFEDELFQLWNYGAIPIITHVSIAAKFTPRYIWVSEEEWNGKPGVNQVSNLLTMLRDKQWEQMVVATRVTGMNNQLYYYLTCANEEVAKAILAHSLKYYGHHTTGEFDPNHPNAYPDDTFFTYTTQQNTPQGNTVSHSYCSYGAASYNEQGVRKLYQELTPYVSGRSYYYTYINNEEEAPPTKLHQTCVERNHYYILRLTSIGSLGVSISDPKYIKVHTLKTTWKNGGKGEIELN